MHASLWAIKFIWRYQCQSCILLPFVPKTRNLSFNRKKILEFSGLNRAPYRLYWLTNLGSWVTVNILTTNHTVFSQLISFIATCRHLNIVTYFNRIAFQPYTIMSSYVQGHSYQYIWEFGALCSIEDVITQPGILVYSFSTLILKLFLFKSCTCIKQEKKHGFFGAFQSHIWGLFKNRAFICYKTENMYKVDVADDKTSSLDSINTTHFRLCRLKKCSIFLIKVSDFFWSDSYNNKYYYSNFIVVR